MSSSTQVVTSSLYEDEQLHPSCDVISIVHTYVAGSNARVHINGLPCNRTTAYYCGKIPKARSRLGLSFMMHHDEWERVEDQRDESQTDFVSLMHLDNANKSMYSIYVFLCY
jgi:hypothetical protein